MAPKIEARSIKKGIKKTKKPRRAPRCQKSRNKRPQPPRTPGVQDPGEGVGGGATPPQRVETQRVEKKRG